MIIPTEPIASVYGPQSLIGALAKTDSENRVVDPLYESAVEDTIRRFEAIGSPVRTNGEQRKHHNFRTYSVHALPNTAPHGFKIPFAAGHVHRMQRSTAGPPGYRRYADAFLDVAQHSAHRRLKQAVILGKR